MGASDNILEYVNLVHKKLSVSMILSDRERCIGDAILDILESAENDELDATTELILGGFEDDPRDDNWIPDDETARDIVIHDHVQGMAGMVRFGDIVVEQSRVDEAISFFDSKSELNNNGHKKRPSLAVMNKKFPFIKNEGHMKKIRFILKNGEMLTDRRSDLQLISDQLELEVEDHLKRGLILHDHTLRFIIATIIRKNDLKIKFTASKSWLNAWKRAHRLSSRRITKFVAKVRHVQRDEVEKNAKDFVQEINQELIHYPLSSVFNADQSGIQLEINTARTLARTGSRKVKVVVNSVSSTTHSFTVMPVMSADGELAEKLLVVLKEPKGRFPLRGIWNAPNLVVYANTSHIMTKQLMFRFMEDLMFTSSMPDDFLFIVDSWSSWKDAGEYIPSNKSMELRVIPPGCTGLVQPFDVGYFGGFKKVVKTINEYCQFTAPDFKIQQRDSILKVLNVVHWQFRSPKLKPWRQYSWNASGYDVPRPVSFKTPAELMFPRDVAKDCDDLMCSSTAFIVCIYCEDHFCFKHFVVDQHHCP